MQKVCKSDLIKEDRSQLYDDIMQILVFRKHLLIPISHLPEDFQSLMLYRRIIVCHVAKLVSAIMPAYTCRLTPAAGTIHLHSSQGLSPWAPKSTSGDLGNS